MLYIAGCFPGQQLRVVIIRTCMSIQGPGNLVRLLVKALYDIDSLNLFSGHLIITNVSGKFKPVSKPGGYNLFIFLAPFISPRLSRAILARSRASSALYRHRILP